MISLRKDGWMKDQTYWVLNYLNAHRSEEITLENAKGRYLPRERWEMSKAPYWEAVDKVLGTPSFLEKAEMLLLEIEEGEANEKEKMDNIINFAYAISNASAVATEVSGAYAALYDMIPIEVMCRQKLMSDFSSVRQFQKDAFFVSAEWLGEQKNNYLKEVDPERKAFLEYIFKSAYNSLKKKFLEVKKEIIQE